MLRRALACVQSCQSLHCSRTSTKWAYIWQFFSVNAQTRPSMHAVLPEPSLLSYIHKMGVFFGIFYQSMFRQTLACVQSRQTLHCSHTCTERAYIRYISSVNAQTHMSICAVSLEPSLLSHMHKMGVHTAYS